MWNPKNTWYQYKEKLIVPLFDDITDRVRSTTGRLCFDTCLSIHQSCLSTPGGGGVPEPGPGGVPQPGPAGGGVPRWGGYTNGGYPNRGRYPRWFTPHVRPGRGVAPRGGYLRWGTPHVRPGWGYPDGGGYCDGVYPPKVGYPPSDLDGGVPQLGGTLGATPMGVGYPNGGGVPHFG